jgi:hypothetical protein
MKYLKVICENTVDVVPEVVKWNSWDGEHLKPVHGAYNQPRSLFIAPNTGLLLDSFKIPFLPLRFKTIVFTSQNTTNCQLSYTLTPFFLAKNAINVIRLEDKKTLVRVVYEFEANGFWALFFPLIKRMIVRWNKQVWAEDLPLKLRRQRALEYGFVDFLGLPESIKDRQDRSLAYECDVPVKTTKDVLEYSHPFFNGYGK